MTTSTMAYTLPRAGSRLILEGVAVMGVAAVALFVVLPRYCIRGIVRGAVQG